MSLLVKIEKRLGDFVLYADFECDKESLAVLGESGAGKSLLLKCIAGIERPDSGCIILDDRILFDSEKKINFPPQKRRVGYLFQNYALFPNMTVYQNISGTARNKDDVNRLITRFGLGGKENDYPAKLSGGEQQRVALARLIASEPEVFLFDEPFSALDSNRKSELERLILDLLEEKKCPSIIVTHDRNEAFRMAKKVAVFAEKGKVSSPVEKHDFFENPLTVGASRLSGCIIVDILVPGDSIANVTITGSQTHVGTSLNTPSNARITICTADTVDKNPSYAISYANGTLEVIPNDTLITVIPASGSKVYDGTPLTKNRHFDFTVTGVPEGLTWTATADGTVTNVTPGEGEKAVNAVTSFRIFDANNVDVTSYFTNINTSATGTLTITPKPLTITADDATRVYDGTALTKNSYTNTELVDGETITSVTITGSQTIAGTSNNVPSDAVIKNDTLKDVTSNYDITYVNGTLEVLQKSLTITAGSDTIIYNGAWLTNNTYTHSALVAGDSLWSVTITGRALYGESNNVPSDAVIKNAAGDTVTNSYKIDYVNGHLKIKQKKLTITSGDSSKVYDGTELTCHSFTYSGLVEGDYIESVQMPSVLSWADTIDNDIYGPNIQNSTVPTYYNSDTNVTNCYEITYVKGKLMVEKKPLTITAGSATKEYDGTALTQNSYTHTELVPGESIVRVSIVGSQTTAGTSENVPSDAEIQNSTPDHVTDNYKITYVNGTLKVTPHPLTITADGATKEYDGTALTQSTYTHTALIEGDSIWSVTMTGSQTLVGSSNNVPSGAIIKNDTNENVTASYAITYKNDTLRVTPNTNEIVVTPSGGSKEYDGTPLTKTEHDDFTVTGLLTGFTWTAAADGTVTNVVPGAGEKAVNAVSEFKIFNANGDDVTNQFSNITKNETGMLTIIAKDVTLASGSATRKYNGTALTNDEVEGRNANEYLTF